MRVERVGAQGRSEGRHDVVPAAVGREAGLSRVRHVEETGQGAWLAERARGVVQRCCSSKLAACLLLERGGSKRVEVARARA